MPEKGQKPTTDGKKFPIKEKDIIRHNKTTKDNKRQMPDYKQGKIYAIRSYQTDQIYIGSTTNPLHKRIYQHRKDYEYKTLYVSSFEILKYDDNYTELIEMFPCNNRMELCKRGEIIRASEKCINKQITGRTKKEWINENKEKLNKYSRNYYKANHEKMLFDMKGYYSNKDNRDKQRKWQKENREKNRDKLDKKMKCVCGSEYIFRSRERHYQTRKHKIYMDNVEVIGLSVFGY